MQKYRSTEPNEVKNGRLQLTAAIETRAADTRDRRYKPLKLAALPDIKVTPNEIKKLQEDDVTLKRYFEMANLENNETQSEKVHFVLRNGLLYRKYN